MTTETPATSTSPDGVPPPISAPVQGGKFQGHFYSPWNKHFQATWNSFSTLAKVGFAAGTFISGFLTVGLGAIPWFVGAILHGKKIVQTQKPKIPIPGVPTNTTGEPGVDTKTTVEPEKPMDKPKPVTEKPVIKPTEPPEFNTVSLFGISLPLPTSLTGGASTASKDLLAKVSYILEGVLASHVLSDNEKQQFREMNTEKIVQDPSSLKKLLLTAYEISLVAPFLNQKNPGPELPDSMTLVDKAEAVRKHLKENGDSYTDLECNGMLCFPTEFCSLQNLQSINLSENRLTTLPPEIGQLKQLKYLNLSNNRLTTLPPEIGGLTQLQNLYLSINRLITLPQEIGQLTKLQILDLSVNKLTSLPEGIGGLAQLQNLFLKNNQLTDLPPGIGGLAQLQNLDLSGNQLTDLPPGIGGLAQLQYLDLRSNQFSSLPEGIGGLKLLQHLDLSGNHLTSLPQEIGGLAQLIRLYLGRNQLTDLPEGIGGLTKLQILDLSNNRLTTVPDGIWRLTQLQYLDLSDNQLSTIPDAFKDRASVRSAFPDMALKNLSLAGNPILEKPET